MFFRITLFCLFSFFTTAAAWAQWDTSGLRPPISRMLFHDKIDQSQRSLLKACSKKGKWIHASSDSSINLQVTYALTYKIDALQKRIEADTLTTSNQKIKYLRGLENLLTRYREQFSNKDFRSVDAPSMVLCFEQLMEDDCKSNSILPTARAASYESLFINLNSFTDNPGYSASQTELLFKYCGRFPYKALPAIYDNPEVPFADSVILLTARRYPQQLYDYAQGKANGFVKKLDALNDTLVRLIRRMASSNLGMKYFPFLDLLYRQQLQFEDIDRLADNDIGYYKLLTKTQIQYWERTLRNETPLVADSLTSKLEKYAKEVFIHQINELHESPDAVRFRILDPLTPQELYYLVVLGEDDIYTSSYLGVYKRIFERMKNNRGDSLLMSVKFDHFSKFLKMAAAYNKLDDFSKTMEKSSFVALMKAFVNWPARPNVNRIEAAVDVADAYASVNNKEVANIMLLQVEQNCEKALASGKKEDYVIYHILDQLFASKDSASQIDLSATLGITPVYSVAYPGTTDEPDTITPSSKVIVQVFFYGDDDGKVSFASFLNLFNKTDWTITRKRDAEAKEDEWVEIKSIKGKPVWIFANLPLQDKTQQTDPDDDAQRHLTNYLVDNNWYPTVVIHRGHSYHLKYTIKRMKPSARIVVLGSCGGYKSLSEVLGIAEDAHIIASKQVGARGVNEPILRALFDQFRLGRDINWITLWKGVELGIKDPVSLEKFYDYIPPYKNLGALFIKAYKIAMEE